MWPTFYATNCQGRADFAFSHTLILHASHQILRAIYSASTLVISGGLEFGSNVPIGIRHPAHETNRDVENGHVYFGDFEQ
jgi:hypothetical protein